MSSIFAQLTHLSRISRILIVPSEGYLVEADMGWLVILLPLLRSRPIERTGFGFDRLFGVLLNQHVCIITASD